MNGRRVGTLTRERDGNLSFAYRPQWLELEAALPLSLSLPLASTPYRGARVESFFDNLLPDNVEIRRRLEGHFQTDSASAFDLLAAIGGDCVGALQIVAEGLEIDVKQIRATPVSDEEIASTVRGLRQAPLGMHPDSDDFRISLAGAQEKTAFLWYEHAWHRPQGATPTSHIFKPRIGKQPHGPDLTDSVENEWLCLRLARALGLPVARAEIASFDEVTVLVVERFDRAWSSDGSWLIRLPHEDLCQALGVRPAKKYEGDGGPGIPTVMELLRGATDPAADRRTFMRACIAYWLLAAIDGHAKNFSIELLSGGRFNLSPLYDVMSAYPLLGEAGLHERTIRMAMAAVGKNRHYRWYDILPRHWLSTAAASRFDPAEVGEILDDLSARAVDAATSVGDSLPPDFPDRVASPIFEGLLALAKRLG